MASVKSRFFLGSSLDPLANVPFVAAHGDDDDHLRIAVLFASSLGQPGAEEVKTCLAPRTPWTERLDAFEEILRRAQGKRPSQPFAGLIHPDAFPMPPSGDALLEDASFQQERWELFQVLLRSFERGGWVLVRPTPRSETTDALHGHKCVAAPLVPVPITSEDEELLARTMLGLDMSPAVQALVWGLVRTNRLRARSAALLLEGASSETATTVAFETAYDALSIPALETVERLALLRGPQALNGVAGPYGLHEGSVEEHRLPRAALKELIERGWIGLGASAGGRRFAMAEQIRGILYERAAVASPESIRARHRWLAERGGTAVADKVEAHYHAIESRDEQLAIDTAEYYGVDLRRLAHALSAEAKQGEPEKFLRAAKIYGVIVERFDPSDAYAWEYRGYNLALHYRASKTSMPPAIEGDIRSYYRKACELDEDNPLYRGREVGFRARSGEDVHDEFRRWMYDFMRQGHHQAARFASPVIEALPAEERRTFAGPWLSELKRDPKLKDLLG